jgi:signal transduction histidine kinase
MSGVWSRLMQETEASAPSPGRVVPGLERYRALSLDHGLVLAGLAAALGFAVEASSFGGARGPVAVLAVGVALAAVWLRRQRPLEMLFVVAVAAVAAPAPGLVIGPVLVILYSVAARVGRRDTAVAALSAAVAVGVERVVWGFADDVLPPMLLSLAVATAAGLYMGVRRASAAERAEHEREQEMLVAERTAAEERVRIARELHDVVAHTLSLIVVQSEVLATRTDDDELRSGAAGVAELGRAAMGELHRTLDLLRGQDEPAERGPQPVLDDLEQLLQQTREAGLAAELTVAGKARPLAAGVEVSAYRIVQEALTNVRRHADAARVEVRVRYGVEALEVSIEDDGQGEVAAIDEEGHGLRGMRERAAMLGGALSAGPLDRGGYRVSAILPYAPSD